MGMNFKEKCDGRSANVSTRAKTKATDIEYCKQRMLIGLKRILYCETTIRLNFSHTLNMDILYYLNLKMTAKWAGLVRAMQKLVPGEGKCSSKYFHCHYHHVIFSDLIALFFFKANFTVGFYVLRFSFHIPPNHS